MRRILSGRSENAVDKLPNICYKIIINMRELFVLVIRRPSLGFFKSREGFILPCFDFENREDLL